MAHRFLAMTLDLLISMEKGLRSIASKLTRYQDLSETDDQNCCCWSKLPQDLVTSIAQRLFSPEDILAFAGTCKSWRSTAALIKSNPSTSRPHVLPWLALFENDSEQPDSLVLKFFSLSSRKTYELPSLNNPRLFRSKVICSSLGWIIHVDPHRQVNLYNPISKTRVRNIPKLPLHHYPAIKFVVGSESSGQLSIAAVQSFHSISDGRHLSYWREGDSAWTVVKVEAWVSILDVAFYKGKLYLTAKERSVLALNSETNRLEEVVRLEIPKSESPHFTPHDREMLYVLESDGALLVVQGEQQWWGHGTKNTAGFQVYEVNVEEKRFFRVESLGDRALFLGDSSSSFSVRASDYGSSTICEANCVYFADNFRRLKNPRMKKQDFGAFRLSDGQLNYICFGVEGRDFFHPAIWVQPRFIP